MIYYREWCVQRGDLSIEHNYKGWFLFGVIPLYIMRIGVKRTVRVSA